MHGYVEGPAPAPFTLSGTLSTHRSLRRHNTQKHDLDGAGKCWRTIQNHIMANARAHDFSKGLWAFRTQDLRLLYERRRSVSASAQPGKRHREAAEVSPRQVMEPARVRREASLRLAGAPVAVLVHRQFDEAMVAGAQLEEDVCDE